MELCFLFKVTEISFAYANIFVEISASILYNRSCIQETKWRRNSQWKVRQSKPPPNAQPAAGQKKAVSVEAFVFLGIFILIFGLIGHKMGMINLLNTMMNTAFDLLINTVLYIMGIAVLAGALGALLTEFGVVALINKLLSLSWASCTVCPARLPLES